MLFIINSELATVLTRAESKLYSLFCESLEHKIKKDECFEQIHYISFLREEPMPKYSQFDYFVVSSSLVPYVGYGHNENSAKWWSDMMTDLIKNKVKGKRFFLLRDYNSVKWDTIDPGLFKKAFASNDLHTTISNSFGWKKIDVENVIEFEMQPIVEKETKETQPVKKLKKRR